MTTGGKYSAKKVSYAQRRILALEMRAHGATWQQIGDQYYHGNKGNARRSVITELESQRSEAAEEMRKLSYIRLQAMLRVAAPMALRGDLDAMAEVRQLDKQIGQLFGLYTQEIQGASALVLNVITAVPTSQQIVEAQARLLGEGENGDERGDGQLEARGRAVDAETLER